MKQVTETNFETEVLRSKEPVLVDFYTDTCPPCRAMAPVLQELEAEADGQLKVVKVDAAVENALASSFQVNAVPSFFLFSNGKCVGQTMGYKPKASMQKWVEALIPVA